MIEIETMLHNKCRDDVYFVSLDILCMCRKLKFGNYKDS